jgi:phosphate transport system substrate-binding protein
MTLRLLPLLGLAALAGCSGSGSSTRVTAGGATFVDPIMQKWAGEYRRAKGTEIDYTKKGSGYGIQQVVSKNFDFGCTDAPINRKETEEAKAAGGEVIHVPVAMGAVAVIYHVPEAGELKLSGPVLADIYRRKVTRWNDPAIGLLNPGVALPNQEITPVYRAEDSGTTNIFTEYLAKVSQGFKDEIGVSKKPKWPEGGIGQEGSDGVTSHVAKTAYTIGYVEVLYAKRNNVKTALLKNKAGQFRGPDAANVTAAAATAAAQPPTTEPYTLHELTFSLTDADGENAYPIGGVSYAILFKKQPKAKGPAVVEFLKWAVTDGQEFAGGLEYAPLPAEVRAKATARLDQVTFE